MQFRTKNIQAKNPHINTPTTMPGDDYKHSGKHEKNKTTLIVGSIVIGVVAITLYKVI